MNNRKQAREKQSWEEAVTRHLRENPDYFLRHLDLLETLRIPHSGRGAAVSLLERQVEQLRERQIATERQLADLVEMARDNDRIAARLHRFAIALMGCRSIDDILDAVHGLLRQEFDLDAVSALVEHPVTEATRGRAEFMPPDDGRFEYLWVRSGGEKPVCAPSLDAQQLQLLFPRRPGVKSIALVPFRGATWRGLLALGSHDPHRFHAAMGTLYLERLGELLAQAFTAVLPSEMPGV
ncbi:MAG: DUF484 family protein [Acidiferrobacteraceae bacterium]